jgi:protein phosphatase
VSASARPRRTAGAWGIRIELGQASDPGLDPSKQANEDAYGYAETKFGHLFVVCDGMGGHASGKEASEIALSTIFEVFTASPDDAEPRQVLAAGIEEAGRRVYRFGGPSNDQARPGSTCVALLLHDGCIETAHVGDSRAYAIRGKQIYRLTRDHSMVQSLLDQGAISEQEAIGHPDSNKITRALGMTPEVEVELSEQSMELYDSDVFVLATDGLTDLARNEDILVTVAEYLRSDGPQRCCQELVALANRRGGHDNITVQVVRVVGAGARRPRTTVDQPPMGPFSRPRRSQPPGAAPTLLEEPNLAIAPPGPGVYDAAGPPVGPPRTLVGEPMYVLPPLPDHTRPAPPERRAAPPLLWVVLAMAAVIGILLAALMWALFLRE